MKFIKLIKERPGLPDIIMITLDTLWVLLLSIFARILLDLHLDVHSDFDCNKLLKFSYMISCVISYAILYFKFKKRYELAKDKDKENFITTGGGITGMRKRVEYYLWHLLKLRFFFWFLIPFISFILVLFL